MESCRGDSAPSILGHVAQLPTDCVTGVVWGRRDSDSPSASTLQRLLGNTWGEVRGGRDPIHVAVAQLRAARGRSSTPSPPCQTHTHLLVPPAPRHCRQTPPAAGRAHRLHYHHLQPASVGINLKVNPRQAGPPIYLLRQQGASPMITNYSIFTVFLINCAACSQATLDLDAYVGRRGGG